MIEGLTPPIKAVPASTEVKTTPTKLVKSTQSPADAEQERLKNLRDKQLKDRAANSRTQSGAGAFSSTSGPDVVAVPGKSAFTKLTESKQAPVADNTGGVKKGPPA